MLYEEKSTPSRGYSYFKFSIAFSGCDGVFSDYIVSLLNAVTSFNLGFKPQKRLCWDRGRDCITVVVFSDDSSCCDHIFCFSCWSSDAILSVGYPGKPPKTESGHQWSLDELLIRTFMYVSSGCSLFYPYGGIYLLLVIPGTICRYVTLGKSRCNNRELSKRAIKEKSRHKPGGWSTAPSIKKYTPQHSAGSDGYFLDDPPDNKWNVSPICTEPRDNHLAERCQTSAHRTSSLVNNNIYRKFFDSWAFKWRYKFILFKLIGYSGFSYTFIWLRCRPYCQRKNQIQKRHIIRHLYGSLYESVGDFHTSFDWTFRSFYENKGSYFKTKWLDCKI